MTEQFVIDAVDELNNLKREEDIERAHVRADYILCKVLRKLGHDSLVDHYQAIRKFYA